MSEGYSAKERVKDLLIIVENANDKCLNGGEDNLYSDYLFTKHEIGEGDYYGFRKALLLIQDAFKYEEE